MIPKEDPHTRESEGCDVARSNREHQGPREAQRNKVIQEESTRRSPPSAPRIRTPRTRPERETPKRRRRKPSRTSMRVCTSVTSTSEC